MVADHQVSEHQGRINTLSNAHVWEDAIMSKLPRRNFLQGAAGVVAVVFVALSGHAARSQTASTIRAIVPFPAGGVADTLGRMLAEQIGRTQGPLLVIENRAGAGSVIGTEAAARATGWK